MIDDLHIIDFCKDVAKTMLILYRTFPRLHDLYVSDLIGYEQPDEFGLHSKRHESCLCTLLWLEGEDWIRYKSLIRREAIDQCVLTQKAFNRLHMQIPKELLPQLEQTLETNLTHQPLPMILALHLAHKNQSSLATDLVVKQLLFTL